MAESGGREVVGRFARAVENPDFDAQAALLADDVMNEMPQSGERVRGKANWLAIARNDPGGAGTVEQGSSRLVGAEHRWVLSPSFSRLRIEGITRTTTWYAAPFDAPEWRAPYVERFESPLR